VETVLAYDHYIFAAMNRGFASENIPAYLVRIDLSNPTDQDLRFAWQPFLEAGTSTGDGSAVASMIVADSRLYHYVGDYSAEGGGLYFVPLDYTSEPSVDYDRTASGYITSGRIRFKTLEDKLFRFLGVMADPLAGSVDA